MPNNQQNENAQVEAHTVEELGRKLQVLAELERDGHKPEQAMARLDQNVRALYAYAGERGDDTAQQAAVVIHEDAQAIFKAVDGAINLTLAARDARRKVEQKMAELQEDHDVLRSEYDMLDDAVTNIDRTHPLVDDLVADLEMDYESDLVAEGFYISHCPACDVEAALKVAHPFAYTIFDYIVGENRLTDEGRAELVAFFEAFVDREAERHEAAKAAKSGGAA